MTGVELIVAALAAGAAAGVTDATTSAIGDAYAGLKRLLSRRLAAARRLLSLVVGDHNTQTNTFS
jgi:hypothetical protein